MRLLNIKLIPILVLPIILFFLVRLVILYGLLFVFV